MTSATQISSALAKIQSTSNALLASVTAVQDSGGANTSLFSTLLSTVQTETPVTPVMSHADANTVQVANASVSDSVNQRRANTQNSMNAPVSQNQDSTSQQDAKSMSQGGNASSNGNNNTNAGANSNKNVSSQQSQKDVGSQTASSSKSSDNNASTSNDNAGNSTSNQTTGSAAASPASPASVASVASTALTSTKGLDTTSDGDAGAQTSTDTTLTLNQQLLASLAALNPTVPAVIASTPVLTAASATPTAGKSDLQSLLSAIQSGGKAALPTDAGTTDGSDAATTSQTGASGVAITAGKNVNAGDASLKDLAHIETDSNLVTSFFDMFSASFADRTAAATIVLPTASGVAAASGGSDNSSLDLDLQHGANAQITTTDASGVSADASALKATGATSFAGQLAGVKTANPASLPPAVEQVILQMSRNVKAGNDQMTLQLNPAELGKINVKLSFSSDGKVQGTVVADNASTLNMMIKQQGSLEHALREAGLNAESGSLQFSLGDPSGNAFNQTANNSSSSSSGKSNDTTGGVDDTQIASVATTDTYYLTPGGVNLQI
jgi:hypothetical protein